MGKGRGFAAQLLEDLEGAVEVARIFEQVSQAKMQFGRTATGRDPLVEFLHREVSIECLPADIPSEIVLDTSELDVGQSLRIADVPLDREKVRILDDDDTVIAVVGLAAVTIEEKDEAADEDEALEGAAATDETPDKTEESKETST